MGTIEAMRRTSNSERMEIDMARPMKSMASVLSWIETQMERRRSRRALLEMTDEQLKDIGISRADAFGEAHRPFWD